jgi:transcriptional regulator with XRE-family HTH domain
MSLPPLKQAKLTWCLSEAIKSIDQRFIAELLGKTQATVSRLLDGLHTPLPELAKKIDDYELPNIQPAFETLDFEAQKKQIFSLLEIFLDEKDGAYWTSDQLKQFFNEKGYRLKSPQQWGGFLHSAEFNNLIKKTGSANHLKMPYWIEYWE